MNPRKSKKIPYLVLCTASTSLEANKIARFLIAHQLAACVNIIPDIKSVFLWKKKLQETRECLLIIKTEKKQLQKIKSAILKLHSYSVPEIIGWPIQWGSQTYLDWVSKSVL